MLFPGQGSQTADMRDQVERHRPDLLELAQSEVSDDLFERAEDGTRWAQPDIFCAALAGYEVLTHMAGGATNKEIAERLFLSPHTVKEHTSGLYRKLKVRNRAEAVQRAQRLGLLS